LINHHQRGCPGCGFTCEWRKLLALLSQSEQQSLLCIWTLLRSVFSQSRFAIVELTVLMLWSCRSPALMSGFLRAASRFCPPRYLDYTCGCFEFRHGRAKATEKHGLGSCRLEGSRRRFGATPKVWVAETGRKTQKNTRLSRFTLSAGAPLH